jgi:hypothetical protein
MVASIASVQFAPNCFAEGFSVINVVFVVVVSAAAAVVVVGGSGALCFQAVLW